MKQRKKKVPQTCLFCSEVLAGYSNLKRHMSRHTEEKPFSCPVCQMEFRRSERLTMHQRYCYPKLESQQEGLSHVNVYVKGNAEERFKCHSCPVTFSSMGNLYRHKRLKRCKGIQKETGNSRNLKVTTATAFANKRVISKIRLKCDKCPGTFSHSAGLYKHIKYNRCKGERRQEKEVKDSQALKPTPVLAVRLPPSRKLKFKINNRPRKGPFECEKCNAKFIKFITFRRHIRRNSCTKTVFKCEGCQHVFSTNGNLCRHQRYGTCTGSSSPVAKKMENLAVKMTSVNKSTAETQRKSGSPVGRRKNLSAPPSRPIPTPFLKHRSRCAKCSSSFISRNFLKQHYMESHDMKLWSCKLCPDWYCRLDGLQRHMVQQHKRRLEEYRCRLCGLKFASLDILKRHIGKHHIKKKYECGSCHYTFTKLYTLKDHCNRTGHWTDDNKKLPELTAKAPELTAKAPELTAKAPELTAKAPGTVEEKKITPERKSTRVIKPVTPYSPSASPVGARVKKACSPSPDITKPKFYTVTTATTAIKPKSHKKLDFVQKPKPTQQKLDKRSKYKSTSSSSILRPPVFQYHKKQSSSSQVMDSECPKMELLPSPVSSPSQVRAKSLRNDALNRYREQQRQKQNQKQPWDASFFLHMNRYDPES